MILPTAHDQSLAIGAVVLGLGVLVAPVAVPGQTAAGGRSVLREEITPRLRLGVSRGLEFLMRDEERTNGFADEFPVAVNALVGLAFLAGGYTDQTGPERYTRAVQGSTARLLAFQNESGYFDDRGRSRMYGHGFATLYLAELYGMSRHEDTEIRRALGRAIEVIEKSQSAEGGWDYQPARRFGGGSDRLAGDTSITVCQTMALRAARNLGLEVNAAVMQAAKRFILQAQNNDGGFRYRQVGFYVMRMSTLPRSAAGVCILYSYGDYEYSSPAVRRGIRYLSEHYKDRSDFPFYADYYAAQAMFQAGRQYWREYFPWVRKKLLDRQRADGSWKPRLGSLENKAQSTAMALVVLQLPYRFLPIHER